MSDEDMRVLIFGMAMMAVFWGIVALTPCKWFRRLITGWDGTRKESGNVK